MATPEESGLGALSEFEIPTEAPATKGRPSRQVVSSRAEGRPSRNPMYNKKVLAFAGLDPNYSYRIVNDTEGRLDRFVEAGYEFVDSDQNIGTKQAMDGSIPGSRTAKPVGGGTTGYLMRIKKEWYDEDQRAKAERINAAEQATKPNTAAGQYGPGLTDN